MRLQWPWVSRVAYDDMVRIADSEREHNRKLTRIILRLKVSQGAFLPSKTEARQAREVDRIEAAINRSKHAKNPMHRTALSTWAERQKSLGVETDEIVERLLHWDDISGTPQDDDDDGGDNQELLA